MSFARCIVVASIMKPNRENNGKNTGDEGRIMLFMIPDCPASTGTARSPITRRIIGDNRNVNDIPRSVIKTMKLIIPRGNWRDINTIVIHVRASITKALNLA